MIRVNSDGDVTVVTIDQGKVNALDLATCRAITRSFTRLSPGCRAVVLTGGGTCFSAGVDLTAVLEGGEDYVDAFVPALAEAVRSVLTCPRPVVAAVNGAAVAGGAVLACAADVRVVAHPAAPFGLPELALGVAYPLAALEAVRGALGPVAARSAINAARITSLAETPWTALVDHRADPEMLTAVATARARELAARTGPEAFAHTKRQRLLETTGRLTAHARDLDRPAADIWKARLADGSLAAYVDLLHTPRATSPRDPVLSHASTADTRSRS